MHKLVHCIGCSHLVSSQLHACPRCNQSPVEGVECRVCRSPLSEHGLLRDRGIIRLKSLRESENFSNNDHNITFTFSHLDVHHQCLTETVSNSAIRDYIRTIGEPRECTLCGSTNTSYKLPKDISFVDGIPEEKGDLNLECFECHHRFSVSLLPSGSIRSCQYCNLLLDCQSRFFPSVRVFDRDGFTRDLYYYHHHCFSRFLKYLDDRKGPENSYIFYNNKGKKYDDSFSVRYDNKIGTDFSDPENIKYKFEDHEEKAARAEDLRMFAFLIFLSVIAIFFYALIVFKD